MMVKCNATVEIKHYTQRNAHLFSGTSPLQSISATHKFVKALLRHSYYSSFRSLLSSASFSAPENISF